MSILIDLLKKTEKFFLKKGIENPRLEAEKIFAKALKMDRIMLYANYNKVLTDEEKENIRRSLSNNKNEETELKDFLNKSIAYLKKHNVFEASLIAELIFSDALNIDRMLLFMNYNKKIPEDIKDKIRINLKKIAVEKMPYQYVVNKQNFYGRDFFVDKGVLIPRYDTEVLVEEVLKRAKDDALILDIGTGSGAIGISIALEKRNTKVLAIDISDKAIEIARINKKILNANNVKIIKSNLFENIDFKDFDIIVSNPPYISNSELNDVLESSVIFEPHEALFADSDGLYFYYEITKNAYNYLKDGGILAFEIGYKQKDAVIKILKEFNFTNIEAIKDLDSKDRVLIARKAKNESRGF